MLLQEALTLINGLEDGPEVSTTRLKELLEPLAEQKAAYASLLMDEKGTPIDPGLGLLRFAMARLDEGGIGVGSTAAGSHHGATAARGRGVQATGRVA